ncbi:MAG: YicC family protein [Gammaproteobacteria bacterium]|nr:MAG: YicC family protein [Gammaproteobacteria bacterium]
MISSMTAFARHQTHSPQGTFVWEVRAVNHRYLELQFRLPEGMRDIEAKLRETVRNSVSRGKIECHLRFQPDPSLQPALELNETLAQQLALAAEKVAQNLQSPAPIQATEILKWPGVLIAAKEDASILQQGATESFAVAIDQFITSRQREGSQLRQLIETRLESVLIAVEKVKLHLPEIQQALRQKLINRFAECQVEMDTERLEQELVYLAQKIDVDEELDRIETHISEVKRVLVKGGAVGRRLDFLMQELNREANTLGSKSVNQDTTQASVELKVLVEQMREQIQNIE